MSTLQSLLRGKLSNIFSLGIIHKFYFKNLNSFCSFGTAVSFYFCLSWVDTALNLSTAIGHILAETGNNAGGLQFSLLSIYFSIANSCHIIVVKKKILFDRVTVGG